MRMTKALGIPQGSDEFEELWRLAEQERHPDANATAYIDSIKRLTKTMLQELADDLQRSTSSPNDSAPSLPEFVADTAALIARSTEEIARRGAKFMSVTFADGTEKRWKVLLTTERRDV